MSTFSDPGSPDYQPPGDFPGTPGPGSPPPGFPAGSEAGGYQYGGPAAAPTGPPKEALAGFWIRFAGALVDGILLGIVGSVVAAILDVDPTFLLSLVYFTYLHASVAGQTVGNRVVGIRIAHADNGGPIPYSRALIRFLVSILSGIPLSLGYLWMLWDPRRQTWHDKAANTLVVRTSYYPPPPNSFGKPRANR